MVARAANGASVGTVAICAGSGKFFFFSLIPQYVSLTNAFIFFQGGSVLKDVKADCYFTGEMSHVSFVLASL
jgi:putative NIF3 family GTP cyclohydrolase 1 type 2